MKFDPRKLDPKAVAERVGKTLVDLASEVPTSLEAVSWKPLERGRELANTAAAKAAVVSGGMALPPGPMGMLTIVPDLYVVWKIQSQLVADIAAACGKTEQLTREAMVYCLFKHAAGGMVRELVVRVGQRVVAQQVPVKVLQAMLRSLGVVVIERMQGRALSRWLPIIGAVGMGAYAFYETAHVAKTALEFFGSDVEGKKEETKEEVATGE